MKQIALIFLLGLICQNSVLAQKNNYEQLDDLCIEAIQIADNTGDTALLQKTFKNLYIQAKRDEVLKAIIDMNRISVSIYAGEKPVNILPQLQNIMKVFEKYEAWCYVGTTQTIFAEMYKAESEIEKASQWLNKSRESLKKCDKERFWGTYYDILGNVNVLLKDTVEATKNLTRSMTIAEKHQRWSLLGMGQYSMGFMYMRYQKPSQALQWFQKSRATLQKQGYNTAHVLTQLSQIYIDYFQDFQTAKPLVLEQIRQEQNSMSIDKGAGYIQLGEIYLHEKNYSKAKEAYEKAYQLKNNTGLANLKLQGLEGLATYYEATGDYKQAFDYLSQCYYLSAKVLTDAANEKAQEKQTFYNLNAKNEEIEQLEQIRKWQYFLIGALALALLLLAGFFWIFRKQKALKEALHQTQQQSLELQIAHHQRELTSATLYLDQRNGFLNNLKEQIEKGESSKKLLHDIEKNMGLENDWGKFKLHFEQVHPDFFKKLLAKEPNLTALEQKQCAYLRLELNPKQVANLLNIAPLSVSVSRSRIKKKLNLPEEQDLGEWLRAL